MYTLTSIIQMKTAVDLCSHIGITSYNLIQQISTNGGFTRGVNPYIYYKMINPNNIKGHPHKVKVIFCIKFPKKAAA